MSVSETMASCASPTDVGVTVTVKRNNRQALLDATVLVVARGGLRNLTYRAVAAEAGIAHSLVRHYFGTREALIAAALEDTLRVAIDLYDSLQTGDSVETFLSGMVSLVSANPDSQVFQYELMLESRRNSELADQIRTLYAAYLDATQVALAKLGAPPDEASTLLVYAALDGLVLHLLVSDDPKATDAALARLRAILEHELRGRGSQGRTVRNNLAIPKIEL